MSADQPQFLLAPGAVTEPFPPVTLERYPLRYTPAPLVEFNHERLPPESELEGMQLAFRHQPFPTEQAEDMARLHMLFVVFGSAAAVLLGALTTIPSVPVLPFVIFPSAGAISFLMLLHLIIQRRVSVRTVAMALLIPPLAGAAIGLVGIIFTLRHAGLVVFSMVTLIAFVRLGPLPFDFYHSWLYTHPRLKPETRADPLPLPRAPNYAMLVLVLLLAGFGSLVSVALTLAAIAVLCLGACFRHGFGRDLYMLAKSVFAQYLTYGAWYAPVPGVWLPRQSLRRRKLTLAAITIPLCLSLSSGTYLFFPWELFIATFVDAHFQTAGYNVTRDPESDAPPVTPVARANAAKWIRQKLEMTPHAWLEQVAVAIMAGNRGLIWTVPICLAIGALLCPLVLLAVFRPSLVSCARLQRTINGYRDAAGEWHPGLDDDGRTEWEWYVDRLRNSPHAATDAFGNEVSEAEHLFLGVDPVGRFPVLLDRSVLAGHSYIVGETGSGKTSLAIMPALMQLIRGPRDDAPPPPIVIIDVKGDAALFHTVKHEMEKRREALGITDPDDPRFAFQYFTPEKDRASFRFNPFESFAREVHSEIQLCQMLLESLALQHGEGYGRSYYSRRARYHLLEALKASPSPRTFAELYNKLATQLRGGDLHETFELIATVHALSHYPALATTPDSEPRTTIHMPSLLEHSQCAYFWLPAAVESVSVKEISKLAIFALVSAAIARQRAGGQPRQAYMFIDEFQRLAGENFKIVLEQARSFGVAAVLANQTQSDLRTHDIDLRPAIRTNTRVKRYFSITDPLEIDDTVKLSGQEIGILNSYSTTNATITRSVPGTGTGGPTTSTSSVQSEAHSISEMLKSRFIVNDILRISDHPLDSFAQVSRGAGYSQFAGMMCAVRSAYPLNQARYEERLREPWPVRDDLAVAKVSPEEIDRQRLAEIEAAAQEEMALLRDLGPLVDQVETNGNEAEQ